MFLLKFDLLFPTIAAAKEAAKKLNQLYKRSKPPPDPREHKRMLDEIHLAREKVRSQTVVHRNLFL